MPCQPAPLSPYNTSPTIPLHALIKSISLAFLIQAPDNLHTISLLILFSPYKVLTPIPLS